MSDPVSSEEIENVLSSIRRLVSADEKHPGTAQSGDVADAFVLTPALRVSAPAGDAKNPDTKETAPTVEFYHSNPATHLKEAASKPASVSSLESTIAELEAVVGKQGGEWEPDGTDDAAPADAPNLDEKPVAAKSQPQSKAKPAAKAISKTGDGAEPSVDESLKAMIAELMREELKGALGTKITRDVRKVVRQEVKLALKNQDKK